MEETYTRKKSGYPSPLPLSVVLLVPVDAVEEARLVFFHWLRKTQAKIQTFSASLLSTVVHFIFLACQLSHHGR